VGFYASLVNINAYHQPGVEAGKKAASEVIGIQREIWEFLSKQPRTNFTAGRIASGIGRSDDIEHVFKVCDHLSSNGRLNCYNSFDNNPLNREYSVSHS